MKYIVYLFTLQILSSCLYKGQCEKINLNNHEKIWLTSFKEKDLILYKSNFGNIDSFIVETVVESDYTTCNKFEFGDYQYESSEISCKLINKAARYSFGQPRFWFTFEKDVTTGADTFSRKEFRVLDFNTGWFTDLNQLDSDTINLSTTSKTYHTFVFDRSGTNQNPDGSPTVIKTFWWSKYFGLLKYETSQGEVFELQR